MNASEYARLIRHLVFTKIPHLDLAKKYETLNMPQPHLPPGHWYQLEALAAWEKNFKRGIIQLPTGAGKTQVALCAIAQVQRSTLVVVPTLNLLEQWKQRIEQSLVQPVGELSGKIHCVLPITVTTYKSAQLHASELGNRFGLLILDECHHVSSAASTQMVLSFIAPYRLGLTATPNASEIVGLGKIVYQKNIAELKGTYLADYTTQRIFIKLTEQERFLYDEYRTLYLNFVQKNRIQLSNPSQFSLFLKLARTSKEGQYAFEAYRKQREIIHEAKNKLLYLNNIFNKHKLEKIIIFTNDNKTAYQISKLYLIPAITHKTSAAERVEFLNFFREGKIQALVTSKVLNEGIDLPEAQIAVVFSGSASSREYVQRLGRILRHKPGKKAILYELIAKNTSELSTSTRRKSSGT